VQAPGVQRVDFESPTVGEPVSYLAILPEVLGGVSMLGVGTLDPDFMGPRARVNPAERARIFSSLWGSDLEH